MDLREPIATGFEADVYRVEGEDGQMQAVRVYADLSAREKCAREMAALGGLRAAGYPVPALFGGDPDGGSLGRPYVVIEWLPGRSLESAFWSAAPSERAAIDATLYRALSRLHALDPAGIAAWPVVSLADEANALDVLADWLGDATPPICREALAWLRARLASIEPAPPAIVHGDLHRNNILSRADGSWCVIDWSNVRCGDPRVDRGWTWWILTLIAHVAGQPEPDPPEMPDRAWFEALALTRFALSEEITRRFGAASQGLHPAADERLDRTGAMTAFAHELLRARLRPES